MVKVLVVDDDPFIGQLVCRVLKRRHHAAEHCATLEAAHQALEQHGPFSHLLTDARLADPTGGVRLASEVRLRYPSMRVLIMSGSTRADASVPAEFMLLPKPFETAALLAALGLG
ncbi:MAG: response regulator [Archangium sp.]|nr:response regulator [Archangium sp.]